jgi:hypothetical protein
MHIEEYFMKNNITIAIFASLFLSSGLCAMEEENRPDIEFNNKLIEFSTEELDLLRQQEEAEYLQQQKAEPKEDSFGIPVNPLIVNAEEKKNYIQCRYCKGAHKTSIITIDELKDHISTHIVKKGNLLCCNLCEKYKSKTTRLKTEKEIDDHIESCISDFEYGDKSLFYETTEEPKKRKSSYSKEEISEIEGLYKKGWYKRLNSQNLQ